MRTFTIQKNKKEKIANPITTARYFSEKNDINKDFLITSSILLIIWQGLSLAYSPLVLPGPILTLKSLLTLIQSDRFLLEIFATLKNLFIGLFASVIVGSILGILIGINQRLSNLFEPLIYLIQAIPPILFMTLAMIWFGLDGQATIFIVFIASVSILVINIKEGFESIDPKLIEMAKIFGFSKLKTIVEVIIPSLKTYFKSGLIIIMGLGWKLVLMGEFLSSGTGIGAQITDARLNLETNMVFAWGITIIALCSLSQKLIAIAFDYKDYGG